MNDHTQDDKLIALPPKDFILSLRRDALEKAENERLKHKIKKAHITYEDLLESFARGFFHDDKIYGTLKPKEKNELAKICASLYRKRITVKTLPFAAIVGIIAGLGIWNPITLIISFFSVSILFLFGGMLFAMSSWWEDFICGFMSDFQDCRKFLSARRFLKRIFGNEKEILDNQKTGA